MSEREDAVSVERPIPEEDPLVEKAMRAFMVARPGATTGVDQLDAIAAVIAAVREDIERAAREDEREKCVNEVAAMLPACSTCGVEYVEDAELGMRCSEFVDKAATRRCAGFVLLDELSIAARLREGGREEASDE